MAEIVVDQAYLVQDETFCHLTLRSLGRSQAVDEVRGRRDEAGRRSGEIRRLGTDLTADEARGLFEATVVERLAEGFASDT